MARSSFPEANHSQLRGELQFAGIPGHWDYIANMCRISIPAIWDVIWGQTNLFPTSDRPPNPLSRKDRLLDARARNISAIYMAIYIVDIDILSIYSIYWVIFDRYKVDTNVFYWDDID